MEQTIKIAVGCDHVGLPMKRDIISYLSKKGYQIVDFGTDSGQRTDYPIYGKRVADAVASGDCRFGILICGTGVGISLAANKVRGVRAVVCSEPYSASLARQHNDANILAFGARVIGGATAEMIVDAFLGAEYEGGRHAKRVAMLTDIENGVADIGALAQQNIFRAGIDIGGTKIGVGILDGEYRLCARETVPVSTIKDVFETVGTVLDTLCARIGITRAEIVSVGVGIPGTVSADGRSILKVPNIDILTETFADDLEAALGIPVTMMQDSRAAAWGEYLCGSGKGLRSLICMTLGTGIGTGIVLDGHVYHGGLGCAGELGHLPAVPDGRICGCGRRGCVEKYAAGRGLDMTARELLGEGAAAADLFSAAENGNQTAVEAISSAVRMLGNTVVSAVNLLSPEAILFSGGLAAQKKWYLEPLIAYVKEHCYTSGTMPVLACAALGDAAPLIGAALAPLAAAAPGITAK